MGRGVRSRVSPRSCSASCRWSTFTDALDALASPLVFLLVAVPLAVLLDEVGFFASLAASFGGTRHLRLALWAFAAAVTVLFNLDAAVVLLTPLYIHIARRHGDDPLALAFVPALLASLASSVLPVSNLTNLVLADQLGLGVGDFLRHAAPAAVAATVVGWFAYRRVVAAGARAPAPADPVDRHGVRIGLPVVAWLLLGFTFGDVVGLPAWAVAAVALGGPGRGDASVPVAACSDHRRRARAGAGNARCWVPRTSSTSSTCSPSAAGREKRSRSASRCSPRTW